MKIPRSLKNVMYAAIGIAAPLLALPISASAQTIPTYGPVPRTFYNAQAESPTNLTVGSFSCRMPGQGYPLAYSSTTSGKFTLTERQSYDCSHGGTMTAYLLTTDPSTDPAQYDGRYAKSYESGFQVERLPWPGTYTKADSSIAKSDAIELRIVQNRPDKTGYQAEQTYTFTPTSAAAAAKN